MVTKNKKGQDLSIGTLILIVLGVIVLVILILGFSVGWGKMWEKINIFSGGTSVNEVVTACNLAASQGNKYGYCQEFKSVKINNEVEYLNCQDEARIASNIETKINCNEAQKDARTSATWYCEQLKNSQGTNFKPDVKVNGFACSSLAPVAAAAATPSADTTPAG